MAASGQAQLGRVPRWWKIVLIRGTTPATLKTGNRRSRAINRFLKYFKLAATPAFWPTLWRGVLPTIEHVDAIRRLAPKTLIDIGANKGQFSSLARYLFPDIAIHAIEPLESERRYFESVISQPVTLYPTAVGAKSGEAQFFVTSRPDSSSLFRPGVGQERAYGVVFESSIAVPVVRVSDLIEIERLRRPILMKLDIQGGELDALKGAESLLHFVDYIYCETTFVKLYDDQPLASDLAAYLIAMNFALAGVYNQSVTREFGATQADFLWVQKQDDRVAHQ